MDILNHTIESYQGNEKTVGKKLPYMIKHSPGNCGSKGMYLLIIFIRNSPCHFFQGIIGTQ